MATPAVQAAHPLYGLNSHTIKPSFFAAFARGERVIYAHAAKLIPLTSTMASALMLSALRGAIEKCIPMSGSSRSIEVKERTKEMLDKVISEENADVFESLSSPFLNRS